MAKTERKSRPKTGEPRKTHQPFNIDRLPPEVLDAIKFLRNGPEGLTWQQLEIRSAKPYSANWKKDRGGFIPWNDVPPEVLEHFPDRKLSKSTLHNWYHATLADAREDVIDDGNAAQAFVEKLGELKIEGMNDAVMNAMVREVFGMIRSAGDRERIGMADSLNNVSLVLARLQRLQLQQQKVAAEIAKADADKARFEAEAGNPREIYMLAAQDVLKKLRTRKNVRVVLDPISSELIEEIAHGAEAFAAQIEQATA
jgi:hypothetical protein